MDRLSDFTSVIDAIFSSDEFKKTAHHINFLDYMNRALSCQLKSLDIDDSQKAEFQNLQDEVSETINKIIANFVEDCKKRRENTFVHL